MLSEPTYHLHDPLTDPPNPGPEILLQMFEHGGRDRHATTSVTARWSRPAVTGTVHPYIFIAPGRGVGVGVGSGGVMVRR